METLTLKASPRELKGKKVKILRREGQIPAILYGRNFTSLPLVLSTKEFTEVGGQAGESTIINLDITGKEPAKVLIRKIQRDPVTDSLIHVDLYKVDMKQEIQTEIPLEFGGTAPAVEELEGNLITNKDSIRVECLPDKLPPQIEVDLSQIQEVGQAIYVKDIVLSADISVDNDPNQMVARVSEIYVEKVEAAAPVEAEAVAEAEEVAEKKPEE